MRAPVRVGYRNYMGNAGSLKGGIEPGGQSGFVPGDERGDKTSCICWEKAGYRSLQFMGGVLGPKSGRDVFRPLDQGRLLLGIAQQIDAFGLIVVYALAPEKVGGGKVYGTVNLISRPKLQRLRSRIELYFGGAFSQPYRKGSAPAGGSGEVQDRHGKGWLGYICQSVGGSADKVGIEACPQKARGQSGGQKGGPLTGPSGE